MSQSVWFVATRINIILVCGSKMIWQRQSCNVYLWTHLISHPILTSIYHSIRPIPLIWWPSCQYTSTKITFFCVWYSPPRQSIIRNLFNTAKSDNTERTAQGRQLSEVFYSILDRPTNNYISTDFVLSWRRRLTVPPWYDGGRRGGEGASAWADSFMWQSQGTNPVILLYL